MPEASRLHVATLCTPCHVTVHTVFCHSFYYSESANMASDDQFMTWGEIEPVNRMGLNFPAFLKRYLM